MRNYCVFIARFSRHASSADWIKWPEDTTKTAPLWKWKRGIEMAFEVLLYLSLALWFSVSSSPCSREIPQSSVQQQIGICYIFSSLAILPSQLLNSSSTTTQQRRNGSNSFSICHHHLSHRRSIDSHPSHKSLVYLANVREPNQMRAGILILTVIFRAGVDVSRNRDAVTSGCFVCNT